MDSLLGLTLSENRIVILELGATPRGLKLTRLDKIDLPAKSIKDGIIIEPRLVADKISAFIKANAIACHRAVALIEADYTSTRIVRLPQNLSDSQIRLNLEAELNQYRRFMNQEAVIDFKRLEEISEAGVKKVGVLFIAVFKALAESYLKTLELAGLNLEAIDVPLLSCIRALDEVDFKPSSLEVTLLMLIGKNSLEMCVLKGNRTRFLHSVDIDLYDFNRNPADFIQRLASAIKLVVNFYQARFLQGEPISRLIINPLDAKYSQIHSLLKEKLPRISIALGNPLSKIHIAEDKGIDLDELKFPYSCLLGAALRIKEANRPFDLNPILQQRVAREKRRTKIYFLTASLALALGVMVFSFFWVVFNINLLQGKISHLTTKLEDPSGELKDALPHKESMGIVMRKAEEAAFVLRRQRRTYFKNMAKAMVLVPAGLWLSEVKFEAENKNLILSGESDREKPIFDYLSALRESDYFQSAEIVSSRAEAESIKFVIICAIK